ncbi:hypothetical protein D3C71_1675730 [compost metagenome]
MRGSCGEMPLSESSPFNRMPKVSPSLRMSATPIVCIATVPPMAPEAPAARLGPLLISTPPIRSGSM